MKTMRTTTRIERSVSGYKWPLLEPMFDYGVRCGRCSLRPAIARHASNADFLAGLRMSRRNRRAAYSLPPGARIIIGLPALIEQRRNIQAAYGDAAYRARLVAAQLRAADRNDGRISAAGRDVGSVQRDRAIRDAADVWMEHRALSDAYAAKVNHLFSVRGLAPYITTGAEA